jgi:hypothetical protein
MLTLRIKVPIIFTIALSLGTLTTPIW